MDCNYYQAHALMLAQHPSETEERVMIRLLAFGLHANSLLEFGKGLSSEEPDLWRRDLTGQIDLWIEVGQPDEQAIRRACGRARQVVIYSYSGHSAQLWWNKNSESLARNKNLTVIDVSSVCSKELALLARRSMQLQCFVQDGQVQIMSDAAMVSIELIHRMVAPIR